MRPSLSFLILPLLACSAEAPEAVAAGTVDANSFHAWMRALEESAHPGDGTWAAVDAGLMDALPVERFGVKRTRGFDWLELRFERGGAATREGGMADWPNPLGHSWTAELPYYEFARLCWLAEALDLSAQSSKWKRNVSHAEDRVGRCFYSGRGTGW